MTARRIPVGLVAGVSSLILVLGGGFAWWVSQNSGPGRILVPGGEQIGQPSSQSSLQERQVTLYLLQKQGDRLALAEVSGSVRAADEPQSILKGAMQQLLQGANTSDSETFSTIPRQTALLGLRVESDGVHVNLSQEYTSGGGSASMKGRLAQVIYTATSLDPNTSVWIDVEGKPLEVLGGEGVTVSQPMTRQEFDQNFPL